MLYDLFSETNPLERFWDLRRDFDRLLDEASPLGLARSRNGAFVPAFAAEEDEDGLTLRMEVPGVGPDKLNVSVNGRTLTVEGERSMQRDANATLHRCERSFGKFSRSVHLPDQYDPDGLEAKHENGILTIRIAKSAAAKPRIIKIEAH